jgi:selenocysteine-specific elongation factor
LDKALGTVYGDNLIIRKENASETLGGFRIIEASPTKFKRMDKDFIEELRKKSEGSIEDKLISLISTFSFITLDEVSLKLAISKDEIQELVEKNSDKILLFDNQYLLKEKKISLIKEILEYIEEKLAKAPLAAGVAKEEIRSKFFKEQSQKNFNNIIRLLVGDELESTGELLRAKGYVVNLSPEDKKNIDRIISVFTKDGLNVKNPKELAEFLKIPYEKYSKYHNYLLDIGELIKIDENIFLARIVYEDAVNMIKQHCFTHESIEIATAKDILNTSRKYIVPFLEHLDYIKITKRIENKRVLTRR